MNFLSFILGLMLGVFSGVILVAIFAAAKTWSEDEEDVINETRKEIHDVK